MELAFVDNLAYQLFVIGFAALLIAYLMSYVYMQYRKRAKDITGGLKAAAVPLAVLGGYMLVSGIVDQFLWPLGITSPYNILFMDPYVSFGIVLLAFAMAIRRGIQLQFVGLLALLIGVMAIWYGYNGYVLQLTQDPFELLMLFTLFGVAGIFSYPATIVMDRLPGYQKSVWGGWHALLVICWLAFIFAGLGGMYAGATAVAGHLVSPP